MNEERKYWITRAPQEELSKKLGVAAWILSAVVLGLVVLMRSVKIPLPDGWSFAFLPPVHAGINAVAAVILLVSVIFIKLGNVRMHRATMVFAMFLSVLFLLCYVAYHFTTPETRFPPGAPLRGLYLILLITHIVSAAVSLPFILFTFIAGWTNQFTAHRRLARWVFPLWLYVAITGPVCYWMLKPYYV